MFSYSKAAKIEKAFSNFSTATVRRNGFTSKRILVALPGMLLRWGLRWLQSCQPRSWQAFRPNAVVDSGLPSSVIAVGECSC